MLFSVSVVALHTFPALLGRGLARRLLAAPLALVEARLARRVGQRLDAAVVAEAAAVEDDRLDAQGPGPLGDGPAHAPRRLDVAARRPAQLLLDGRGRGEGHGPLVVDDLRVDVVQAAEDREPRARLRAAHAAADARAHAPSDRCFVFLCHLRTPS